MSNPQFDMRLLAEDVATVLGADWEVTCVATHTTYAELTGPNGWAVSLYALGSRWQLTGLAPLDTTAAPNPHHAGPVRYSGYSFRFGSEAAATVAVDRGAKAVAQAILSRVITQAYVDKFAEAQKSEQATADYNHRQRDNFERLSELGFVPYGRNECTLNLYMPNGYGKAQVGAENVVFDFSAPVELAEGILRLIADYKRGHK